MKLKTNTDDTRVVLRSLFENQAAHDAGHALPHKILGVGMGGGFSCAVTAAEFHALQDAGLTHPFTALVMVSGSCGPAGGYLSGVAHRAARVFEYLSVAHFMETSFLGVHQNQQVLERSLDGTLMPLAIDQEKIEQHSTGLWMTAATLDGEPRLLNAKTVTGGVIKAVLASSAMPGTCAPVMIDNEALVDGVAGGNPLPVEEGLTLLHCTAKERPKVLVFQSRIHPKYRMMEWLGWPLFAQGYYFASSAGIREHIAQTDTCFVNMATKLSLMRAVDSCRIAPTLGDELLSPASASIPQLQRATKQAYMFLKEELAQAKPARMV